MLVFSSNLTDAHDSGDGAIAAVPLRDVGGVEEPSAVSQLTLLPETVRVRRHRLQVAVSKVRPVSGIEGTWRQRVGIFILFVSIFWFNGESMIQFWFSGFFYHYLVVILNECYEPRHNPGTN